MLFIGIGGAPTLYLHKQSNRTDIRKAGGGDVPAGRAGFVPAYLRYLCTTLTTYAMRVPPRSQALRARLRVSAENAQTINYKNTIPQYPVDVNDLFSLYCISAL